MFLESLASFIFPIYLSWEDFFIEQKRKEKAFGFAEARRLNVPLNEEECVQMAASSRAVVR